MKKEPMCLSIGLTKLARDLERRRAIVSLLARNPNDAPPLRIGVPGDSDKATAFVRRCQEVFLGRKAEPGSTL